MNSIFYLIVNPFLGFIQAFKHRNMPWAKNSIMFFVAFYGFTMARPEGSDSSKYAARLETLNHGKVTWLSFVSNLYSDGSNVVDIYEPLITFFVSLFTNNANILFAIFGIVYGFFYSRNIFFILEKSKLQKFEFGHWILLITFMSTIGFWNLNGVRMWTAAQIFIYGVFIFYDGNKKVGLMAIFGCLFVHFSFLLLIGLFLFHTFVKVPKKLLIVLYFLSFFVTIFELQSISAFLQSIVPDFLLPKVKAYTNEDYAATLADSKSNMNFYAAIYNKVLSSFLAFYVFLIASFKLDKVKSNQFLNRFFEFCLIISIVANLISFVPSGIRYVVISQYSMVAFLFMFLVTNKDDQAKDWVKLLSPLLIFYLLVAIRIAFDTITLETILFNPLFSLLTDLPIRLIDIIK